MDQKTMFIYCFTKVLSII